MQGRPAMVAGVSHMGNVGLEDQSRIMNNPKKQSAHNPHSGGDAEFRQDDWGIIFESL